MVRSAIGTAIACGAFVTGPMCVGLAVSNADLLGIGGGGGGVDVLGIDLLGGKANPTAPSGRSPASEADSAIGTQCARRRDPIQSSGPRN